MKRSTIVEAVRLIDWRNLGEPAAEVCKLQDIRDG
jgi:hypothetical protein